MNLELDGKRALVTGSSAGIGEAIVKTLAAEGTATVVHGHSAESVEPMVEAIRAAGGRAHSVAADITEDGEVERLADEAQAAFGGIDILVNNAGLYANTTWSEATADSWRSFYQANVVSAVTLIHRLTPGMRERGWG